VEKPRTKECPICGAKPESLFWHLFRKHPKEDIIKAYLTLLLGGYNMTGASP